MKYFEIQNEERNNKKKETTIKKSKVLYFIILIIFPLLIIYFIQYNNDSSNSTPQTFIKDPNDTKNKYTLESIKKNPYLQTKYLLNLFSNQSNINFTLFEKNIKKLKEKIYSLIENKNTNKDIYLTLSCIYGAFLADSMGSFCEFTSFNKNNHLSIFDKKSLRIFKPGQITDDSEMAMSQSFAIMDNSNYTQINEHLLYYYYVIWFNSHPLDIGITTRNALKHLNINDVNIIDNNIFSETIKKKIYNENYKSLANGLLMRISPILSWFYMINKNYIIEILKSKSNEKYFELYNKIYIQISKDSQLTHPNIENSIAASIFIFMGLCSMQDNISGNEILEMTKILFSHNHFNNKKNEIEYKLLLFFNDNLSQFKDKNFKKENYFGNLSNLMGYYMHAFNLTLYYLNVFDEQKKNMSLKEVYNNIIFDICDFGGDTDTNAAIVGMVIGPLIGLENLDKKYFEVFLDFYSKKRIIYTNVLMYYYIEFLNNIHNLKYKGNDEKYNNVSFNFIEIILNVLNDEIG